MKSRKILIVGAGAVGSIYGHYAHLAGHEVHFFVKPENEKDLIPGLNIHQWKLFQKQPVSTFWKEYQTHSSTDSIAQTQWSLVILTFPSDAIQNDWLQDFFSKIQTESILGLQPSANDRKKLLAAKAFPETKLTMGTIPIISYKTPMPGDRNPISLPPGFAYILPPGSPMILDGPSAKTIASLFASSGLSCKKGSTYQQVIPAIGLTTLVRTLEMQEWSIERYLSSSAPVLASLSARQMIQVADRGQKLSLIQKVSGVMLTHPAFIRLLFRLLPKLFPFDIETYLKVHFTKVGTQQQNAIEEFVNQAKAFQLPYDQIQRLLK